MPMSPSVGSVHVNRPLTNISIAELQNPAGFVADRVFQSIPVAKQSDRYFQYPRGQWNTDEMEERAPATESAGSGFDVDNTPTYFCKVYGFHKDIPLELYANFDDPLDPERDATAFVTQKARLKMERLFAQKFLTSSAGWTRKLAGVASGPGANQFLRWSDAASNPIEDVRADKRWMLEQGVPMGNVLTLTRPVFDTLLDHPDIIDRVKYGQTPGAPAIATRNTLAQLFEVDEVLVMDAVVNTAQEGAAAVHGFIGGNAYLLTYRPPAPGLLRPAAGYTFRWSNYENLANVAGLAIKRIPADLKNAIRIEIGMAFEQKLVSPDAGVLRTAVV